VTLVFRLRWWTSIITSTDPLEEPKVLFIVACRDDAARLIDHVFGLDEIKSLLKQIKAITFDLDDTLWEIRPVINVADLGT